MTKILTEKQTAELIDKLKARFNKNTHRHKNLSWVAVEKHLKASPHKLWSINEMEATGGEPDVIGYDEPADTYIFCDCAAESPIGRRSMCYDHAALESRKEFKPKNSAVAMAGQMGIELLNEEQYRKLQETENFDTKTSSWLLTPGDVRKQGGALFGDFRYGRVFIYHNGAESYYAVRGFRGVLKV